MSAPVVAGNAPLTLEEFNDEPRLLVVAEPRKIADLRPARTVAA